MILLNARLLTATQFLESGLLTALGSDHREYNMKKAELFRNDQNNPEVLEESKGDKIPGERCEGFGNCRV